MRTLLNSATRLRLSDNLTALANTAGSVIQEPRVAVQLSLVKGSAKSHMVLPCGIIVTPRSVVLKRAIGVPCQTREIANNTGHDESRICRHTNDVVPIPLPLVVPSG